MEQAGTDDPMARAQFADIQTYLIGDILTKVDRASMAHSLEVRAPLLDHELVEWPATVPPDLKIRSTGGKYIFKKALEPYVPHENLYRTKQGFATSLAPQSAGWAPNGCASAWPARPSATAGWFRPGPKWQSFFSSMSSAPTTIPRQSGRC